VAILSGRRAVAGRSRVCLLAGTRATRLARLDPCRALRCRWSGLRQIKNIEQLAGQVRSATGQWQNVQDAADKTEAAAREIAERMTAEAQGFKEFMQRANESEKANLRLEVDKLRRAEADWLQVLVRVLDHVYALHLGAVRSGQPNLIEQMSNFQNACRDAARRVGLAPFIAALDEPFDGQRHQLVDGTKPAPDAVVGETLAAGYTFQSRLVRPALVRLQATPPPDAGNDEAPPEPEPVPDGSQSQLPLEPSANASPS
jgi:molecular chaperone GrpE (heat shock protein)